MSQLVIQISTKFYSYKKKRIILKLHLQDSVKLFSSLEILTGYGVYITEKILILRQADLV